MLNNSGLFESAATSANDVTIGTMEVETNEGTG
jgi:hypothetical protein